MNPRRVGPEELPLETVALARSLIGHLLVRRLDGVTLVGRIVETEAYPPGDPASHAFRGRTPRNAALFGPPHRAYIYFIYGSSYCANVVSDVEGVGAAVLVRALEPLSGLDVMRSRRGGRRDRELCRGPGRLCAALGIDRRCDGLDLTGDEGLWLAAPVGPIGRLRAGRRVGISVAVARRWRFWEAGNPFVSLPNAERRGSARP
ncbi:MAG: DNA-3-methyladenine glycosylase [Vulcanimicrobiaceae bacterium]